MTNEDCKKVLRAALLPKQKATMSPQEVADLLGLHYRTIMNWIYKDKIPYIRIARKILIPKNEVERLLSCNTNKETHNDAK